MAKTSEQSFNGRVAKLNGARDSMGKPLIVFKLVNSCGTDDEAKAEAVVSTNNNGILYSFVSANLKVGDEVTVRGSFYRRNNRGRLPHIRVTRVVWNFLPEDNSNTKKI